MSFREGAAYVTLQRALDAVTTVFVDEPVQFANDTIQLSGGTHRRQKSGPDLSHSHFCLHDIGRMEKLLTDICCSSLSWMDVQERIAASSSESAGGRTSPTRPGSVATRNSSPTPSVSSTASGSGPKLSLLGGKRGQRAPATPMVDFDNLVWTCVQIWWEQAEADKVAYA